MNNLKGTLSRSKSPQPPRPPPPRLVISDPVPIKPIAVNQTTQPIKRQISKPSRPPPIASADRRSTSDGAKPDRPPRPPRPKDRDSVALWWREVEYQKGSGVNESGEMMPWFHGELILVR